MDQLTDTYAGLCASAHATPAPDLVQALHSDTATGLSGTEARKRLEQYGPNRLETRGKTSWPRILVHQLASPVVYLLGAAAALAAWFGDWVEAFAILVVLALNTIIGFVTEFGAARSMDALRALGTRNARVRRDGEVRVIPAEGLVPGDIVVLEAGDAVPADLRLVECAALAANESTLTGESTMVDKDAAPVADEARLPDRTSMLFQGTTVTRGTAQAVVVATGAATELGHISTLVSQAQPDTSPLEKGLARLSAQLVRATMVLVVIIAGVGVATGGDLFLMIEAAIALAVAAIPEGLPIVATLTLARGMRRMASRNALIEQLPAVETLGATTVILTDKTGTLTENRMTVVALRTASGEYRSGGEAAAPFPRDNTAMRILVEVAVLCNEASLTGDGHEGSGDPMELALLRLADVAGIDRAAVARAHPLVRKYPFEAATRMMATVHREPDGFAAAVKGAPEAVIARATSILTETGAAEMDEAARRGWVARVEDYGGEGLRVLALAFSRPAAEDADPFAGLTLVGLVALQDPARPGVPEAIAACKEAGIRVIMATGDHAITARSIGQAIGLADENAIALEGAELDSEDARNGKLLATDIFSRVSPAEKLDIVCAHQANGAVVAMTGDGVNDAPALRQADIGVAMGQRGTDVAREAAAMVLLDDAFPTIVNAVREGRVIFGNIRRFAAYLLSCNLSEVLVVGLSILSMLPLPLLPLQILYLNLVTDVFPAFALALGEGDENVMRRKPRNPKEPILGRNQWIVIVLQSLTLTAATFAAMFLSLGPLGLDQKGTVTVTFLTLAFAQLWHVLDMHAPGASRFSNEVTRNKWVWAALALCSALLAVPPYMPVLADVLGLAAPDLDMWLVVMGASLAPMLLNQIMAPLTDWLRARPHKAA